MTHNTLTSLKAHLLTYCKHKSIENRNSLNHFVRMMDTRDQTYLMRVIDVFLLNAEKTAANSKRLVILRKRGPAFSA